MFHAFTGCDTASSFAGREKKTAFDIWKSFNEITPVFSTLLTDPSELNDDCVSVLEAFIVLLYDCTCTETTVNLARKHIFTTKSRSMDNLPPPRAALSSTQNEQYTRVDMCGGRHPSVVHLFPLQKHTVGRRVRRKDGNSSVHCCQKRWPHVLNY